MIAQPPGHAHFVILILLLAIAGTGGGIGGCRGPHSTGSIDQVVVMGQRFYVEEGRSKVQVVAKVENIGKAVVKAVEVHVTLRNSRGSICGTNMVLLEDLRPAEVRVFDVGVTRHGAVATATVELAQPERSP